MTSLTVDSMTGHSKSTKNVMISFGSVDRVLKVNSDQAHDEKGKETLGFTSTETMKAD